MVVGTAENCAECFKQIETLRPDIVVLDLLIEDSTGSKAITQLRKNHPDLKILIYSAYEEDWLINEAMLIGVDGYVVKKSDLSILIFAIKSIRKGDTFLDTSVTSTVIKQTQNLENRKQQKRLLTAREIQILQLIAKGYRNKSIAASLFIEESTVKCHVSSIFTKLTVSNRIEAILVAKQQGMLHE